MNRRDWLRRAALIAGGVIAADQIELIERLTPKRYVNGWMPEVGFGNPVQLLDESGRWLTLADHAKRLPPITSDEVMRASLEVIEHMEELGFSWPEGILFGKPGYAAPKGLLTLASGT